MNIGTKAMIVAFIVLGLVLIWGFAPLMHLRLPV